MRVALAQTIPCLLTMVLALPASAQKLRGEAKPVDGVKAAQVEAKDSRWMQIFPGMPPGNNATKPEIVETLTQSIGNPVAERCCPGDTSLSYFNVSTPAMKQYHVERPRAFVIVLPGGGFEFLALRKEGEDIAKWLNSVGISAFVLKYRVPVGLWPQQDVALIDVQRAMSILRRMAPQYNVDKSRIGVIGFSAGGALAAKLSGAKKRAYTPIDAEDKEEFAPNFQMLIYGSGAEYYEEGSSKQPDIPNTFLASAQNDQCVPVEQVEWYASLIKSAELYVPPTGDHGYGACTVYKTPQSEEICKWPQLAKGWLEANSLVASSNTQET